MSGPSYTNYIEWLNIPESENDPIAILVRSRGQKATDKFEMFSYPEPDQNGLYHLHFFAKRIRYSPKSPIKRVDSLPENEPLHLVHDAQNSYDPFTLLLQTEDQYDVGYCPRYLARDIYHLMQENAQKIHVRVARVNLNPTLIQLRLLCHLTAECPPEFRPFSNDDYQPLSLICAEKTIF